MRIRSHQGGFSFAEAVMAMAVLLIGVLAVLQLFPAGIKLSAGSRSKTIATNLAQGKMEELYSVPYQDILTEGKAALAAPFDKYSRQVDISFVDKDLNTIGVDDDLKKIIITVYWTENQQEKKVEIATLISKT